VSPIPQSGAGYAYAPVVQAAPGASESSLKKAFGQVIANVGTEVGKEAVHALFGQHA
jgi:hypothetical protein